MDETAQQKLKEHQKELHAQRQERGLERFRGEEDGDGAGEKKRQIKRFESYKREDQLPKEVARRRVSQSAMASRVVFD